MRRIYVFAEHHSACDRIIRSQNEMPNRDRVDFVPTIRLSMLEIVPYGSEVFVAQIFDPSVRHEFDQLVRRLQLRTTEIDS